MKIIRRITIEYSEEIHRILQENKIRVDISKLFGNHKLLHFNIAESHHLWSELPSKGFDFKIVSSEETVFNEAEIRSAKWNRMICGFENSYPHIDDIVELGNYIFEFFCDECGIGINQQKSYRTKKEVKIGKKHIMSLNDEFEFYTTHEVFSKMEASGISGYQKLPLILDKTDRPSEVVSQIFIDTILKPGFVAPEGYRINRCPKCGIDKHEYHRRGIMQISGDVINPEIDIAMTHEWFGAGGRQAYREVIISQKLTNLILDMKWKRVKLKPVELVKNSV
ncbi:MAG: hypothetical protein JEZ06_23545 [Anaerolineaceae bacterium]|nr:hypothetical protein [Anaerolineaceae bacterium]